MSEVASLRDTSGNDGCEPAIIAFLCNWCSYRGADLAGTARLKYPPNLRVVRVPCSGRVAPELVLRAFQEGADGVLVLGCHIGECHYHEGNHRMVRRMQVLQRLLGCAGIGAERLRWDYVSAAEGERFARIVSEFSETVRGLPRMSSKPRGGETWRTVNVADASDFTVRGKGDARWPALREVVDEALADHAGVLALRSAHGDVAPHLFQSRDELDELALWPKYPLPGIVRRLQDSHREARLAVVCRACEERGLVEMAKHRQVDWSRLTLIGLACSAEEVDACRCAEPAPLHAGVIVGEPVPGVATDRVLAALPETSEDRLAFWLSWIQRCIKCYACRNACPQCFCHDCALEDDLWVERGRLPPPYPVFHLIKAFHMAGKCVACRECEMACPAEIPITILYRTVSQDVEELFGYHTGAALETLPPLLLQLEEDVEA